MRGEVAPAMVPGVRTRALSAAIALLFCLAGCIDPADRRPGLWLSGETAAEDNPDWSFTADSPEIFLEVHTPYLLRHSVTIVCAADDAGLYVGARNPGEKRWVGYVARDPDVRLEISGQIYERRLERIDDPATQQAVYRAYAAKYGWPEIRPADSPEMAYFRVVPRT